MITNYFGRGVEFYKSTNKKTKQTIINEKPTTFHYSTKFSKSVDLSNSYCRYYRFSHRNYLWWKFFIYYFLEICVSNTFIIISHYNKKATLKYVRSLSQEN